MSINLLRLLVLVEAGVILFLILRIKTSQQMCVCVWRKSLRGYRKYIRQNCISRNAILFISTSMIRIMVRERIYMQLSIMTDMIQAFLGRREKERTS